MAWLVDECRLLCEYAAIRQVRLAFEPEPGMFIDTMTKFAELHQRVNHPKFGLTIDIGHLHCQGETPIADQLRRWRELLWNVHIEDMRRGVHDHLMFGEGEIDFGPRAANAGRDRLHRRRPRRAEPAQSRCRRDGTAGTGVPDVGLRKVISH